MSRNILLKISYDGTNFCGWQRQDGCESHVEPFRTVQGELEAALEKIHKRPTSLQGSGRTDSGVHARAQYANFISPVDSIPVEKYIPALHSLLPHDIRILDAREVPSDFSARFNAVSRTYRYFISTASVPFAHEMPYIWSIRRTPNLEVLNEMASCLRGEIDCTTFASSGDKSESKFRYIYDAHFFWEEACGNSSKKLVFEITANAFLWRMVRSLTGTLIEMEGKKLDACDFKEALKACDRKRALFTAPPNGLFLWDVCYNGERVHK